MALPTMKPDENMDTTNIDTFDPPHCSTQIDLDAVGGGGSEGGGQSTLKKYKKLIQRIVKREFEAGQSFTAVERTALEEIVKEAEGLYKKSNSAHELLFDAKALRHLSRICRQYAEEITLNR